MMATFKEVDHTDGSVKERPSQEEEEEVEEQPYKTPERRHVDALLDISEEDFLRELEPHEYHCYPGWEEAVQGWARVAPMSCILMTHKRFKKPKHKETDNPTPLPADPTVPNTDSSASIAEHRGESHVCRHNSFKKSMPLNQHTGSWSSTAVAALQKDTSEWTVLDAVQKTMSNLVLEEKMEEEGTLRRTPVQPHHQSCVSENRPAKPQKHSHRPGNTVVPIKNFTFLPPIKSPNLNAQRVGGQLCSGKTAPEGESIEEHCFMFDKRSKMRGTRAESFDNQELPAYSAAQTSKYRTCQHSPHLFSAVSVSIPKRYQVPMSSKPDTVHRSSYSIGKSLTQALQSSTEASAQTRIRPNKTVCAVKLYEGCEINV